VAPESNTQEQTDEDLVRLAKDVPVWATEVVELESLRSSLHLRNSLMIAYLSCAETNEGGSVVDGCDGGLV